MTKYARITGKVFGSSATATGNDPEIGQFGSALAGTYNGTTDVATIQSLPAWQNGFIGAVTPTTQFPPLPEMTGFGKVLSQQICYLLQQGIAEYDSGTTYYVGNWVSYNSSLYVAKADGFSNVAPTDTTKWNKFTGGSSRNLGEYVTSSLPLTDSTLHIADGALLTQTDYPEFYSYVANLYNSLPSPVFQPAVQKLTHNSDWSKIAYGNGKFVAVSIGGTVAISTDGSTWTESTIADLMSASDITFDGTNFVVITTSLGGSNILTSSDGENWTIQTTSLGDTYNYIEYGNSKYVVINNSGLVKYASSITGTWISGGSLGFNIVQGLTYGDGKFVALSNIDEISYSTNITNWTTVSFPGTSMGWGDVIYDGEKFIAIREDGYITESDGNNISSWSTPTQISNLGNNNWIALAYGNLKTIALGISGYISIKEIPYTNVFASEADWQSEYATYGECGKYVYNASANTVRIPLVNSYFTNTVNPQILGDLTPASLPNIKGSGILNDDTSFCSGALYDSGSVSTTNSEPGGSASKLVKFDASRSNAIYSDTATTVNTQSVKQLVYIVVKK